MIKTRIPAREVITVRLQDGTRLRISNKAKQKRLTFSDALREALNRWLAR